MIRLDFSMRGDRAVQRKLKALIPRLRKQALSRSMRVAMKPLRASIQARAPKDSGLLRRAIRLQAYKKNRRGIVGIAVAMGEKWFKGESFYGGFHEFGWHLGKRDPKLRVRGKWTGIGGPEDKRPFIPGKHFVEFGFQAGKQEALAAFTRALPLEIHRIVTGG